MRPLRLSLLLILAASGACAQSALPDAGPDETSTQPTYKVVAYFPQWGIDGETPPYNVKNVVTSGTAPLLTHLIYAFANISNNKCASYGPEEDYGIRLPATLAVDGKADSTASAFAGNFHQLQELKALYPKLTIMISIGGGAMNPRLFSVATEPSYLKAFVASCIAMYIKGEFAAGITEPGIFTGIDIDWEFPASEEDKTNYLAMLREFRRQLTALGTGYTLSSTAPTGSWAWDYMDLDSAQASLNFFNAMMYDFDGSWSNDTGFVAPLYKAALDPDSENNASYVVKSFLSMGVEQSKIVFGMPFYAYHWTEVPTADNGLFQTGTADQNVYQYTYVAALKGYTLYRDPVTHEPWLYSSAAKSFWTYDDVTSLEYKTKFVVTERLAGVMVWELSGDTPQGTLMKALVGSL